MTCRHRFSYDSRISPAAQGPFSENIRISYRRFSRHLFIFKCFAGFQIVKAGLGNGKADTGLRFFKNPPEVLVVIDRTLIDGQFMDSLSPLMLA